ncbi:MAG: recombinase family protein [Desulfovibrio sp.]|uniref:recombinase family protein n=1 Tax=Desulfovibrio sp. 7SRBS1 TaxID=3378064 RepID=UPI003B3E2177
MGNIAYKRVSSIDQKTDRQLADLNCKFIRTFKDTVSAVATERPDLEKCKDFARKGDILYVHSIDRLARNLADLLQLLQFFTQAGVEVHFYTEKLVFKGGEDDPFQKLQLQIIGAVAEFERQMIKSRQKEGILKAKKRGVKMGRPTKLTPAQIVELQERVKNGANKKELAKELGISRQTLYRHVE